MSTLLHEMQREFVRQCHKHNLAPDSQKYAEEQINSMTKYEFLQALSVALDEILRQRS
jgi:hypothetical protein